MAKVAMANAFAGSDSAVDGLGGEAMANAATFNTSAGVGPHVDGANGNGNGSTYHVSMANASAMDGYAVDGPVGKEAMANAACV